MLSIYGYTKPNPIYFKSNKNHLRLAMREVERLKGLKKTKPYGAHKGEV